MPGTGHNPMGHITLQVIFGNQDNFRKEWITFEVPDFDYSYNAIIGRLGLAKFIAIPHYTYLVLKMPGEHGVISIQGDFKSATECNRTALQAALSDQEKQASINGQRQFRRDAEAIPKDSLSLPTQEGISSSSMQPAEKTKKINLGLPDASKVAHISSSLSSK